MSSKRILIYSPNIGGHRQVYCNVIANWALESNMKVLLYIGNDWCNGENGSSQSSPYIDIYKNNDDVSIIDGVQKPFLMSDSELLLNLESKLHPDFIFAISGDEFNHSLPAIVKSFLKPKKHISNWAGIFISCYCYPDSDNWLKKRILKFALKQKLKHFDVKYWLDEYFVKKKHGKNSLWVPDISKSFNFKRIEDTSELKLYSVIDNFMEKNKFKEVLLFFGRDFNRKGFGFLVELALDDDQFVILRTGDSVESDENRELMDKMDALEKEGRLLNINQFIKSPALVEKIFNTTNFIPLPYRNHYSSSGVMLQAMEFKKPVIVPDVGLMGKRVIDNNVGLTYKHKDYSDFKESVYMMQKSYNEYINNVICFYNQFSKENIFSHLDIMLNNND
ncbi:glycosyltransferase family 1 protein [Methanohalophilus sp. RSK]|uniref:glycosyltransferase n=1 Tax=Methanohalophilus sp. RSK TaxID=2485783 RepID=UPI000F43C2C7|nr:glycosyltransferase [Methanohalophilus sp. RSK]RNI15811.1 glycosyltransferase family 1 protein [Methanohalophilus sp. RSK]